MSCSADDAVSCSYEFRATLTGIARHVFIDSTQRAFSYLSNQCMEFHHLVNCWIIAVDSVDRAFSPVDMDSIQHKTHVRGRAYRMEYCAAKQQHEGILLYFSREI